MWPLDSGRLDALAIIVAFVWLVTAALPGQQCGPRAAANPMGGGRAIADTQGSHRRPEAGAQNCTPARSGQGKCD